MNSDHSLKIFDYGDLLDIVITGQGAYGKIYRDKYQSEPYSLIYFCFMKFTLLTIIKQNIKIIKSKINIF